MRDGETERHSEIDRQRDRKTLRNRQTDKQTEMVDPEKEFSKLFFTFLLIFDSFVLCLVLSLKLKKAS